jgi:hypothetical protein
MISKTSNQQLIFHIVDLILENEQHFLKIDNLFDDDKIGYFVKSIQIDSSYQQMKLEGILTETVREEQLHVCFTVE